ncbi:carbohydrate kinase family protein [bacterium]|nr:carbohydrate kinase family protein [bacterium]
MSNNYDIVTIGSATRDLIAFTNEGLLIKNPNDPLRQKLLAFEIGAKIYFNKIYSTNGGGAANAVVSFSKLGLKPALISRIGNDNYGQEIISSLKNRKIDTKFIQKDKKEKTAFSFILTFGKIGHTIFSYRGALNNLKLDKKQIKKIKTKWFYISPLTCPDWKKILNYLFTKKAKFSWNPGLNQIRVNIKKYLKKTDILILNDDEARELIYPLARKNKKLFDIKYLFREIHKFGVKNIAITCGAKGAYASDGKKIYYQKAPKVKLINSTGAGDAFASAFTASLFYKANNLKRALSWGIKNSSSVIRKIGAQNGLLNLKQIYD